MNNERIDEKFLGYLVFLFGFVVFVSLTYVTFKSPIAFGDEGFYSSMGRWISENIDFPKYYPLIGTDKIVVPSTRMPLGFVNSAMFYILFKEAGIKLMMPFFVFLTSLLIFVIMKRLGKPLWGFFTSIVFLLLPATVKYGVLNYPENQMIMYATGAFLFFFLGKKEKNIKWFILSGIFSFLAFMSDITGVFVLVILGFYLLIRKFKDIKELFFVYTTSFVLFVPWILRNFILYKNPCIPSVIFGPSCGKQYLIKPLTKLVEASVSSSNFSLFQAGILNYIVFGFGLTSLIIFISIVFLWEDRRRFLEKFLLISLFGLFLLYVYIVSITVRFEELLRYTLFSLLLISLTLSKVLEKLTNEIGFKNKNMFILSISLFLLFSYLLVLSGTTYITLFFVLMVIGEIMFLVFKDSEWVDVKQISILLILLFLIFSFSYYGTREVKNMYGVKHNLDTLVEACQWAQEHLPKDAVITLVYAHPAEYNCYRKTFAIQDLPDTAALRLFANDTSYEILKRWGIDYVIIEGFTISVGNELGEHEPLKFVNYLERSDKFEKIYDSKQYGFYRRIRIFKVK